MKIELFCMFFLFSAKSILAETTSKEIFDKSLVKENETNSICNIYNFYYPDFTLYAGNNYSYWFSEHELFLRKPWTNGDKRKWFNIFYDSNKDFLWELIPETNTTDIFYIKNLNSGKYLYSSNKTGIFLHRLKKKVFLERTLNKTNENFLWKIQPAALTYKEHNSDEYFNIVNIAESIALYGDFKWFSYNDEKNVFIGTDLLSFRYRWRFVCILKRDLNTNINQY